MGGGGGGGKEKGTYRYRCCLKQLWKVKPFKQAVSKASS